MAIPVMTTTLRNKNKPNRIKLRTTHCLYVLGIFASVYVFFIFGVAVQYQNPQKDSSTSQDNNNNAKDNSFAINPNHQKSMQNKVKDLEKKLDEPAYQIAIEEEPQEEKKPKPKAKIMRPNWRGEPWAHMVEPEVLVEKDPIESKSKQDSTQHTVPEDQVLTAYVEPINEKEWEIKPLPVRDVTASDLTKITYRKLNSCSKLPEQFPVDDYPDDDTFLPWIHDVFPTEDGKFIQFVAQNRRRCNTGHTPDEEAILEHNAPQVALFQHVALKKIDTSTPDTPRYRLSSHEDADPESIDTRFICRFKPSGDITFSVFNNDYEWVAIRKGQRRMFNEDGRDNKQIQTSQLLFRCPVPDHLVEQVRTGASVVNDWATIFIDLIPVRTPPRYGPPEEFLKPYYSNSYESPYTGTFKTDVEWGKNHILPKLEDSGRWENIPVCKPSLMTYEPQVLEGPKKDEKVKHNLVSCLWASTGYTTRGNRYAINDGQRRMLEWITFNKILGFDHFYIFDNSGAFTNHSSLKPFEDIFPGDVTVINWPSRVCNNNPNNVDSPGERSSQYAAESSCRLRFGPHVNWIGYVIPLRINLLLNFASNISQLYFELSPLLQPIRH
jgi:hypothetical protein